MGDIQHCKQHTQSCSSLPAAHAPALTLNCFWRCCRYCCLQFELNNVRFVVKGANASAASLHVTAM
jgi:hypothetical protein